MAPVKQMIGQERWETSRDFPLPFSLELDSGHTLVCHQVLRCLPGRRLVCRATRGSEVLLLKLFLGDSAESEAEEDAAGVRALMAAGIRTPALLSEERVAEKAYPALLFKYLADTRSFRERWETAGKTDQRQLLGALLEMVADLHQAGLRQRDFHLRNFLVDRADRLFAIDGGDYAVLPAAVSRHASVRNLGILFGHLPLAVLKGEPELLHFYTAKRRWPADNDLLVTVLSGANRFRRRRARVISRKAFRDCSEFMSYRSGMLRIHQRRDLAKETLDKWIQAAGLDFAPDTDHMLKDGNSQTVWLTRIAGKKVVVKRFNLKNWRHRLRRAVSRSRAARSWGSAHALRAYHIPTPQPLAMIEERHGPFRGRAWLITEWIDGVGAKQYFRRAVDNRETRGKMADLAGMVVALGQNGLVHGDMKATNFMLGTDGLFVIDLDSMHRPWWPGRLMRGVQADRKRFLDNWEKPALREGFRTLLAQLADESFT